jgi:hypothetical protein
VPAIRRHAGQPQRVHRYLRVGQREQPLDVTRDERIQKPRATSAS